MIYQNTNHSTMIHVNNSYEGESLERQLERILANNEPIDKAAPIIYTERKEGVKPEHDIRTDRFEIAQEAMNKVTMSHRAMRENKGVTLDKGNETTYVTE